MRQLLLNLPTTTDYSAASFWPTAGSAAARQALADLIPSGRPHEGRTLVLVGAAASGKSHLLAIWQAENTGPLTAVVDDLEQMDAAAQEDLFHTYNRLKEQGGALLVAANQPVKELELLADLKSRLLTASSIALEAPTAVELKQLLVKLAADRQLKLPPVVVDYLLARAERSAGTIRALVEALDALSLEHKRAITVPLVRKLFEEGA